MGAAIVATRFVIDQTTPAALAMMRYLIGFLCLLPVVLLADRVRFERRDVVPIALLGITQFGVVIALLNFGLRLVPASRAALVFATAPLLTMLVAAALGRERLTEPKTLGVVTTLVGVGLALGETPWQQASRASESIGVLAISAGALSTAVCSVLYRPYLRRYPTVSVGAFAMLASVGFLAVLAAGEGFFDSPPRMTTAGWLAVVFIGVGSGVGYFLWLWALRHATPTKVTVFLALSPITAALLGVVLLGERMSGILLLAVGCVVGGLWLAHRPRLPFRAS